MNKRKVTRWYCDFCGLSRSKPAYMEKHEKHCFKNPQRTPYQGELSASSYPYNDYYDLPEWHPDEPDLMYYGDGWVKIPGYGEHNSIPERYGQGLQTQDRIYHFEIDVLGMHSKICGDGIPF